MVVINQSKLFINFSVTLKYFIVFILLEIIRAGFSLWKILWFLLLKIEEEMSRLLLNANPPTLSLSSLSLLSCLDHWKTLTCEKENYDMAEHVLPESIRGSSPNHMHFI